MTPAGLDVASVGRRLRFLQDTLDDLEHLRGTTAGDLRADSVTRGATERFLQVAVDLAIDINAHVAVARVGRAPDTGRSSFAAMAEAGAISSELAEELASAAGLRNVLVHRYVDIDPAKVADAIAPVLDGFGEYVISVAATIEADEREI